ncbi:hypothetical protein Gogos_019874, partial [Gossypium gossypioides]|nr:hypothetical protein [Gossypium gossypioides]
MKILDKIEGKGGAISLPVVATLTVVFISMVYDVKGIWTKDVVLNAADEEVLMEKTSFALWKRLETFYATKSLANRLVLKQRLFTFRMN